MANILKSFSHNRLVAKTKTDTLYIEGCWLDDKWDFLHSWKFVKLSKLLLQTLDRNDVIWNPFNTLATIIGTLYFGDFQNSWDFVVRFWQVMFLIWPILGHIFIHVDKDSHLEIWWIFVPTFKLHYINPLWRSIPGSYEKGHSIRGTHIFVAATRCRVADSLWKCKFRGTLYSIFWTMYLGGILFVYSGGFNLL